MDAKPFRVHAVGASDGKCESFHCFTRRLLAEQDARYASLSFAQEQRRLRIHLRHILVRHGVRCGDGHAERDKAAKAAPTSSQQLRQWKEAAAANEQRWVRRHASASVIQRLVRSWQSKDSNVELPSSSQFVAIQLERPANTTSSRRLDVMRIPSFLAASVSDPSPSATVSTITEPLQVIVELLGARDLASHDAAPMEVVASVRILHQTTNVVLGSLTSPPLLLDEGISWDDQVLQIGVDEEKLSAERVIQDCAVVVDIAQRKELGMVSLGRLSVSMDLLETPLAEKYAMTRWFPLERGRDSGGRPARGEIRLGIRFMMRNPRRGYGDDDVWVPYVANKTTSTSPPKPQPSRPRPSLKKARPTSSAPGKPPLSPRKRETGASSPATTTRASRRLPPVRRARAEAISPPSSPSSYSSDSNALDSEASPAKAPSPKRVPLRRRSFAKSKRPSLMTSRASRDTVEDEKAAIDVSAVSPTKGEDSGESPKKFLKRKPYKVVFQKLDWSRVGSKTDSNWGSGAKSGSVGKPQAPSSPVASRRGTGGASTKDSMETPALVVGSPSSFLKSALERVASVAEEVHTACKVTAQTAPLAQMRYRSDRKWWLQSTVGTTAAPAPRDAPSTQSVHTARLLTDDFIHSLWMELHGDADGSRYAALLEAKSSTCT